MRERNMLSMRQQKVASIGRLVLSSILAVLATVGLAVASCDSIDTAFDCDSVCSRYRDCYDSSYDVGACRDSCRTRAANDPNVKGAADTCEACIGDKSCLSATFNCGSSCSNIVP
jgi:hypothetical protein